MSTVVVDKMTEDKKIESRVKPISGLPAAWFEAPGDPLEQAGDHYPVHAFPLAGVATVEDTGPDSCNLHIFGGTIIMLGVPRSEVIEAMRKAHQTSGNVEVSQEASGLEDM